MPRALITGAGGQDGILLSQLLLAQGYDVWALATRERLDRLRHMAPHATVLHGDVLDPDSIRQAFAAARPDEVYNLAAVSSVGLSWDLAAKVMAVNTTGTLNLLEEIRLRSPATRYYQASSSEMFGNPATSPQDEGTPFHPRSPYGVSKVAAHFLTINFRESYDLFACCGILYNHESPLREPHFVTRKITRAVAAIERGDLDRLVLGSLDVSRDWGYAPDHVRAMWLMLQQDRPDDYIVATGASHTLSDFLATAFAAVGISDWRPYVEIDDSLRRPAEVRNLVGDPTKARTRLGWVPSMGFAQMVRLMVDHDRAAQGRSALPQPFGRGRGVAGQQAVAAASGTHPRGER